jgi:hypothetical protein
MSEKKRAYFYRIALSILLLLAVYGVVSRDELPALLEVVAAVLGIGSSALATKNTSTRPVEDN